MSAAKPGWYPDPATGRPDGPPSYRWWDGTRWSDATGESVQTRVPRPSRPAPSASHPTAFAPRGSSRGGAATAARWTLLLAFAASVSMVAGLIVWREPADRGVAASSDGAASVSSAEARSAPRPIGRLDKITRRATLGTASLILPEDPYVLYEEPMRVPGLIDEFFQANAVVHPRHNKNREWSAVVGLAAINASRTQFADLDEGAADALHRFAQTFYGGTATTVRDLRTRDHAVDGHPGVWLTAEVHYRLPALSSRYDVVTAVLVRLDDGSVVVAFSSVPDDAPAAFTTLAQESLATLTIS